MNGQGSTVLLLKTFLPEFFLNLYRKSKLGVNRSVSGKGLIIIIIILIIIMLITKYSSSAFIIHLVYTSTLGARHRTLTLGPMHIYIFIVPRGWGGCRCQTEVTELEDLGVVLHIRWSRRWYLFGCRPDMTCAVDWALKSNYLCTSSAGMMCSSALTKLGNYFSRLTHF